MAETLYFASRFSDEPKETNLGNCLIEIARRLNYLEEQFSLHWHRGDGTPLDQGQSPILFERKPQEATVP